MQAACLARCNGAMVDMVAAPAANLETLRRHVASVTAAADRHIVVSYSRKQFLQTGVQQPQQKLLVWTVSLGQFVTCPSSSGAKSWCPTPASSSFRQITCWLNVTNTAEVASIERSFLEHS